MIYKDRQNVKYVLFDCISDTLMVMTSKLCIKLILIVLMSYFVHGQKLLIAIQSIKSTRKKTDREKIRKVHGTPPIGSCPKKLRTVRFGRNKNMCTAGANFKFPKNI